MFESATEARMSEKIHRIAVIDSACNLLCADFPGSGLDVATVIDIVVGSKVAKDI